MLFMANDMQVDGGGVFPLEVRLIDPASGEAKTYLQARQARPRLASSWPAQGISGAVPLAFCGACGGQLRVCGGTSAHAGAFDPGGIAIGESYCPACGTKVAPYGWLLG